MHILSITELSSYIRDLVDSDAVLADVWVQGEVSNWSRAASGHCYWTLKEGDCQLRAVCFRQQAQRQPELPSNGHAILAHGRVAFWEGSGQIQFYVDLIRPAGLGLLHAQIEALKQRLAQEGLFDEARKRPLPAIPRRIGLVTSPTGAAFRDILSVLARRWPLCEVVLAPSLVQGEEAPESLVEALFNLYGLELDLIIVARGGGSIEDLWAFNDERLVRAIVESPIPVISGIGHETDFTLADFAADLRAPTPTAAAELAAPATVDCAASIGALASRMRGCLRRTLDAQTQRLDVGSQRLARPSHAVQRQVHGLALLAQRMTAALHRGLPLRASVLAGHGERARRATSVALASRAQQLAALEARLQALDPQRVLERGYAWLADGSGRAVQSVRQMAPGDTLQAVLADGSAHVTVRDVASR
jgi:exodeoxyribonuclease VII large subunit